ncbi:hypothetical protein AVEN_44467-1 [Araneus ventricosus]|uniref:Uncharacterized protein n=1 Tax=Araneus ventricosus TaxID=182803 RepID=A0A4Y2TYK1_ARAVE|nr:hypothetical protein AVEN_213790-1 [Araneus ventricosus]GBO05801.1 hypothetical protein AVEN_44467-1 [Araneus ventricosus]
MEEIPVLITWGNVEFPLPGPISGVMLRQREIGSGYSARKLGVTKINFKKNCSIDDSNSFLKLCFQQFIEGHRLHCSATDSETTTFGQCNESYERISGVLC